jgi:hypothetical protein
MPDSPFPTPAEAGFHAGPLNPQPRKDNTFMLDVLSELVDHMAWLGCADLHHRGGQAEGRLDRRRIRACRASDCCKHLTSYSHW